jgi:uncharacterized protein YoaH (UPF0181 family)
MSITINPELESKLRSRARAEGITVEAYVERLLHAEQLAEEEIETLALQGIQSGEPIETGPDYWEEKHRRLDARLNKTAGA